MSRRLKHRGLARRLARGHAHPESAMQLGHGARIAVIGGGPAGAFFSYFLLRLAQAIDLDLAVDIFEPRSFGDFGPAGCNHCGGIVSESLVQLLAMDGIQLPPTVVQRGIEAYVLHTDDDSVRIAPQVDERRIAAIYRGGGPRGLKSADWESFDGHLLKIAREKGAQVVRQMITDVAWEDARPVLTTGHGERRTYDLVVVASGVNSRLLEKFEALERGFKRPRTTTAFVAEFDLGRDGVEQRLGSAMHVFLLDLPRLEFAALIPKSSFATLCLLGDDVDAQLVETFLAAPAVKACLAGAARSNACHCFPRINIDGAAQPYADRLLFIGDCGVTRLYKDGVGAAYRTAKAAATAALLGGVSTQDFRRHFWPACRKIAADNRIGKLVFAANDYARRIGPLKRAMLGMTAAEQAAAEGPRDMSAVLWDVFTGSAPYREILMRAMQPRFAARFGWHFLRALAGRRLRTPQGAPA